MPHRLLLPVSATLLFSFAALAAETYYVKANSLRVRLCPEPDCPVASQLDFGAKVTVRERKGDWARISAFTDSAPLRARFPTIKDDKVARWVALRFLSMSKPERPAGSGSRVGLYDPRITYMPRAGDGGLKASDILILRKYAAKLLASGECAKIVNADKSKTKPGRYFVTCASDYAARYFTSSDVR